MNCLYYYILSAEDLLTNMAILLDNLLDKSDELCKSWSCVPLLTAIIEALRQLR